MRNAADGPTKRDHAPRPQPAPEVLPSTSPCTGPRRRSARIRGRCCFCRHGRRDARVERAAGSVESRVARAASFFRRGSSRERSDSKDYSSSARASRPSTRDTSARSSWLAMKEARGKEEKKKKMTYAERREAEKRAGKHSESGRRSARGDDAPRIRDLSRDAAARSAQQPPPPRRAVSAQPRRTGAAPAPRRARDDSHRRALRPPADAPSWQQLKARALAADDAAMASYIQREGGFTSVGGPFVHGLVPGAVSRRMMFLVPQRRTKRCGRSASGRGGSMRPVSHRMKASRGGTLARPAGYTGSGIPENVQEWRFT